MKKNQMLIRTFVLWIIPLVLTFNTGCGIKIKPNSLFSNHQEKKDGTAEEEKNQIVSLACWNAQTFFDAVTTGTEYSDFTNSSKWTTEKYKKRLDKLCEVMSLLNADVLVLEEIVNEAVVQDIANRLTDGAWSKKKGWQYACFAKEEGSAIGCAVFSRYEIKNLKVHSLDICVHKNAQPSERPIMQLTVCPGEKEFELFVNHWKSKSGGEEETEIWRDWQEAVLAHRVKSVLSNERSVVMCGDFNRSAEDFISLEEDFSIRDKANLLLRDFNFDGDKAGVKIYSPWFTEEGKFLTEIGSYFYDGSWERIDNFFFAGKIEVCQFQPVAEPPVADENSIPQGYKVYTDSGCSDHLPLKCIISI